MNVETFIKKSTAVTTFTMSVHLQVSVAITPHWKVL